MQLLHLSSSCDHTIVIISFILMKDWIRLSWLTSLLTPVDSLRPWKRRLCYHLSRSLFWTLRSKISVQSVTCLIFLNCRSGLGLSSLWSNWLPTIYILSFNRRINSNTARRQPYLKLRRIFWCLWRATCHLTGIIRFQCSFWHDTSWQANWSSWVWFGNNWQCPCLV